MDEFITSKEFADLLEEKRPDILDEMVANEPEYQIARSIIAARLQRNWSQQKLAEKARLTQTQVSRLERAQIGSFRVVMKAFKALGLGFAVVPQERESIKRRQSQG
jgi:ribosome-binding protein aMBF1 (putative translation factor)